MNGPEHYAEAERNLKVAEGCYWQGPTADTEFVQICLRTAQVHAALAHTAATVNAEHHEDAALAEQPSARDRGAAGDGLTWRSVLS